MAKIAPVQKKIPSDKFRAQRAKRPAAADPHSANPDESDGPFPIVGIGMSAGGLEVATEFLKAMPPDSGLRSSAT